MKQDDDWLTRLQKKMTSSPPSPEEVAENAAERKAGENTRRTWAQLQDNGEIAVRISMRGEKGEHGSGDFVISPDEDYYEKGLSEYDLKLPGDTRCIKEKWIDDKWIVETSDKINTRDTTQ